MYKCFKTLSIVLWKVKNKLRNLKPIAWRTEQICWIGVHRYSQFHTTLNQSPFIVSRVRSLEHPRLWSIVAGGAFHHGVVLIFAFPCGQKESKQKITQWWPLLPTFRRSPTMNEAKHHACHPTEHHLQWSALLNLKKTIQNSPAQIYLNLVGNIFKKRNKF